MLPTNTEKKQELWNKYEKAIKFYFDGKHIDQHSLDAAFDFFYSEIEQREKELEAVEISKKEKIVLIQQYDKQAKELMRELSDIEAHYASQGAGLYPKEVYAKIKAQEELLKAAHKVIVNATYENMGTVKFQELVNEYTTLKQQQ